MVMTMLLARRLWLLALLGFQLAVVVCVGQQVVEGGEDPVDPPVETSTNKSAPVLTGIPQIDYIHDPNLPFELKSYDMSDYPFYNRVPDVKFNFSCEDRHDGFYASIPHKCQVYHNCLFNTRYDFLCPNYTVFDQSNFICHYASEVNCDLSERYFDNNLLLYETTTTPKPVTIIVYRDRLPAQSGRRNPNRAIGQQRRKSTTTEAPVEEYYYDENYTDDNYYDYYDEPVVSTTTTTTTTKAPKPKPPRRNQKQRLRQRQQNKVLSDQEILDESESPARRNPQRPRPRTTSTAAPLPEYDYIYDDYEDIATTTTVKSVPKPSPVPKPVPFRPKRPNFDTESEGVISTTKNSVLSSEETQVKNSNRLVVKRPILSEDIDSETILENPLGEVVPTNKILNRRPQFPSRSISTSTNNILSPIQNKSPIIESEARLAEENVEEVIEEPVRSRKPIRRAGGPKQVINLAQPEYDY